MANYTTINKSTDYFNTKLWTGNGGTQSITGVGFQSDFTWIKRRDAGNNHRLTDAVRGVEKEIYSDGNWAQDTRTDGLTAFSADGFTIGNSSGYNGSGGTFASWNWKANGAGSANTDGSISSTVSVNATSGFSIVKFTGTGSLATVGHGLGSAPKMIIMKNTNTTNGWEVYHQSLGNTGYIQLNSTETSYSSATRWNNTSTTNNVFTVNTENGVNKSGSTLIAYCFAEKTGYSKFGSYTGNGATFDNAFVYTGFKPSLLIIKRTDTTSNWVIEDNKRAGYNQANYHLYPNLSNAEGTNYYTDFLSNGFKIRDNPADIGASGGSYIYMAFGQSLVGSNNVPCTAR